MPSATNTTPPKLDTPIDRSSLESEILRAVTRNQSDVEMQTYTWPNTIYQHDKQLIRKPVPSTLKVIRPYPSGSSESSGFKDGKDEDWSEDDVQSLPEKTGNRFTRTLRFIYLSTYRKIFAFIFLVNIAVLIVLAVHAGGTPVLASVGTACGANLVICVIFRQENFVNLIYEIYSNMPRSLPLWIRRRLAKVFHYGGCHSGCGVAAVFWYLLYTALATRAYVLKPTRDALADMMTSWILTLLFCFMLVGAYPKVRVKYHDSFEVVHRFSGWTVLATFWIQIGFAARVIANNTSRSVGIVLVQSPNFWFIIVATSCIFLTWSRLRFRKVDAEVLSEHAIRFHFKYKAIGAFYGVKVSDRPLTQWHAFATIPEPHGDGFTVLVSAAGDWTEHHVKNPPTKLWIRGNPLCGLLYTSKLFKRIVVVASGSGIGPCLSLLYANRTPVRVLWSTRDPETTYGTEIVNRVRRADPLANIWNTTTQGYPDMVEETWKLVAASDAEAVFIISNPKLTGRVVFGMEARGIPAYGPIFDS